MKHFITLSILGLAAITTTSLAVPPIPTQQVISQETGIQNEEQVWVSPTDSSIVIAVWRDFRLGYRQIGIGRCTDGYNWGAFADSLLHPDQQIFNWQSDPTLTVDRHGNFYICVIDFQNMALGYDSCYLAWHVSTDQGISWSGPFTVTDTIGPWFEDKQFTAVDRTTGAHSDNIYVAWARYYNNGDPVQIMFARSTTGAVSWDDTLVVGPPVDASACDWSFPEVGAGQFSYPLVASDGSVYVLWVGTYLENAPTCEYAYGLNMVKSSDGGISFSSPSLILRTNGNWSTIDGAIEVHNQPVGAADITGGPFDGNLYIAYANLDTSNTAFPGGDYNIEFIRSTDGGSSWSTPLYINDDFVGNGAIHDQFHPWLFCNEQEGVLVSIWYDQRLDMSHYLFWVYAAYSFDGGATFTTNHRISEIPVDPSFLGKSSDKVSTSGADKLSQPSSRAGRIAEYIGVTAVWDRINAVWTGTGEDIDGFLYGQSIYGSTWEIPFMPPRLLSPSSGATVKSLTDSITFTWATAWKLTSGLYYRVLITDENLGVVYYDTLVSTGNELKVSKVGFNPGQKYTWKIKAYRLPGPDSTDYSPQRSFFVDGGGGCCLLRADVDNSGTLDISDLTYYVAFMFNGGPDPPCPEQGDIDGSSSMDVADLTYLVAYLFLSGPAPPPCL